MPRLETLEYLAQEFSLLFRQRFVTTGLLVFVCILFFVFKQGFRKINHIGSNAWMGVFLREARD